MSMAKTRYCDLCGAKGKIIESRQAHGVIRRRLECGRGHRFTTLEIKPESTGRRALTARVRALAA